MADIKTRHAGPAPTGPVEGDGISYRGIVWFVVILVATTAFCQLVVWGMYEFSAARVTSNQPARAPVAVPEPAHGQLPPLPPGPNLLTNEPMNLRSFRTNEDAVLSSYGWVDRNAGTIRIPIERAKDLVLERGVLQAAPAGPGGTQDKQGGK